MASPSWEVSIVLLRASLNFRRTRDRRRLRQLDWCARSLWLVFRLPEGAVLRRMRPASARSHRQVISRALPTEFPCRLWNALGRANSVKKRFSGSPSRIPRATAMTIDRHQEGVSPTGIDSSPSATEDVTLRFLGIYGLFDLWKPSRRIRNTQGEPYPYLQV